MVFITYTKSTYLNGRCFSYTGNKMKITASDREKIFAYTSTNMSISEITRQLNKGKDKKLQFTRQAVSKILNEFKSCGNEQKVAVEYKEVARTTYDKAVQALSEKMNKASVQDLLKTIEFYDKLYHFSDEQSENNVTGIEINIVDGTGNDTKN